MDKQNFFCAITDLQSNIIYKDINFENMFKINNEPLYDNSLLYPYKKFLINQDKLVLEQGINSQVLLINIFEENIILKKMPFISDNKVVGIHIMAENFYINPLKKMLSNDFKLNPNVLEEYKIISGYSLFQQEIIFCLLMGIHSDKSIVKFIGNKAKKYLEPRAIKDSIREIFKKVYVSNRDELVLCLHHLNFGKYIPKTLFPAGLYNNL